MFLSMESGTFLNMSQRNEIFCSLNGLEIFEKEINIKVVVEDLVGNKKILNKRLTLR